jgi:hypothetical protein
MQLLPSTDTIPTKYHQHGGRMKVWGNRNISVNERYVLKFYTVRDLGRLSLCYDNSTQKCNTTRWTFQIWTPKAFEFHVSCYLIFVVAPHTFLTCVWTYLLLWRHLTPQNAVSSRNIHPSHSVISQKTWVPWQASRNPLENGLWFAGREMR